MSDVDPKIYERINSGQCPICAKLLDDSAVVVNDVRYGKVKVCNTHKVAKAAIHE